MKAISVKQPWASMIIRGQKTIETRTWATKYRGDLLIVSSKNPRIAGHPTGRALGVVALTDCRPMVKADEAGARCELYPGAYAWELKNVRLIMPFEVRGQLGIYDVDLRLLCERGLR